MPHRAPREMCLTLHEQRSILIVQGDDVGNRRQGHEIQQDSQDTSPAIHIM